LTVEEFCPMCGEVSTEPVGAWDAAHGRSWLERRGDEVHQGVLVEGRVDLPQGASQSRGASGHAGELRALPPGRLLAVARVLISGIAVE
jgi:hypothetical protein